MKPIMECLRAYIMQYPSLKDGLFGVDHLGNGATEYTVEQMPTDPIYQRYTDGSCLKQCLFVFASREAYSADAVQNAGNLAFYEAFGKWIEHNNVNGVLPDLDGREAVSLEVLTAGYNMDADTNTARYQMQLRLIYEE